MKLPIVIAVGAVVLVLAPQAAFADPDEYNRGYYDCRAGRYDEYDASRSYRRGCRDAQEERGGDDRPRHSRPDRGPPGFPPPGPPPGRPGPPPFGGGGVPDLRGMDPVRALRLLGSRGYANVGTSIAGGAVAGIYFNPQTRQCLQVTSIGGRVANVIPSGDSRCR